MNDTTGAAQNYYEHEKVRVICDIEIGYKKGNEASRKDALLRATELHLDAAGVSANGCYRARVVSAKIADESQERRVAAIRDASGHSEADATLLLRSLQQRGWDVVPAPESLLAYLTRRCPDLISRWQQDAERQDATGEYTRNVLADMAASRDWRGYV
jgi:hypothetical protein